MFAVVRHRSPKLGRSVPHSYLFQAITTIELSGIATACRPCPSRIGANVYGLSSDTNTIRIGLPFDGTNGQNQTFIAGIRGTTVSGGLPVVIDPNGQLGTATAVTIGDTLMVLTKMAQEQQATIADLQARLARLESLLTVAAGAGGAR
jgi:hypothetical protein